jgi:hypothetical protein
MKDKLDNMHGRMRVSANTSMSVKEDGELVEIRRMLETLHKDNLTMERRPCNLRGSSRSPSLRLQSVLICKMTIFPLLRRRRTRNPACTPRKADSCDGFLQSTTQTCKLRLYNRSTKCCQAHQSCRWASPSKQGRPAEEGAGYSALVAVNNFNVVSNQQQVGTSTVVLRAMITCGRGSLLCKTQERRRRTIVFSYRSAAKEEGWIGCKPKRRPTHLDWWSKPPSTHIVHVEQCTATFNFMCCWRKWCLGMTSHHEVLWHAVSLPCTPAREWQLILS